LVVGPSEGHGEIVVPATVMAMSEPDTERRTAPEPTIYTVESLPDEEVVTNGCQLWTGEGPSPCDGDAENVFVYAASIHDDDDRRRNVICCNECAPAEVTDA